MQILAEEAIEAVSEKISTKLQDQIKSDVFTTPNEWYERTGEFEKSFKWGDIKTIITYMKDYIDIPIYFQPYFPKPEETAFSLGRQLKIITVREGVFKWGDIKKIVSSITKELSYDPSDMSWNPKKWQHGNPNQSAINELADILNLAFNNYTEGYTSDLMFGNRHFSHRRKPYWENFIKRLFDQGELEKMFTEELSKRGFTRI